MRASCFHARGDDYVSTYSPVENVKDSTHLTHSYKGECADTGSFRRNLPLTSHNPSQEEGLPERGVPGHPHVRPDRDLVCRPTAPTAPANVLFRHKRGIVDIGSRSSHQRKERDRTNTVLHALRQLGPGPHKARDITARTTMDEEEVRRRLLQLFK